MRAANGLGSGQQQTENNTGIVGGGQKPHTVVHSEQKSKPLSVTLPSHSPQGSPSGQLPQICCQQQAGRC